MADMSNLCFYCMTRGLSSDHVCANCGTEESYVWAAHHHLRPKTVLNGKYTVGRVIGEGGFGITYVGWDIARESKVAVKEYFPGGFVSRDATTSSIVHSFSGERGEFYAEGKERFIEEAQKLARFFGLPGIVSVHDFFNENSTAYIVMEFLEGATMKAILESMGGKMHESHVLAMVKPLILSLAEMHKQGVIHRDIAPDNIMVLPDGTVKLLDFGAARDLSTDGKSSAAIMKHGYAPEEQYDTNRTRQGTWTDVYALCATIFRAIEGHTPPDAIARLRKDEFGGITAPVSDNTRFAISKGLALQPENRWKDMVQLAHALYQTAEERVQKPKPKPVQAVYGSSPHQSVGGRNSPQRGANDVIGEIVLKTASWAKSMSVWMPGTFNTVRLKVKIYANKKEFWIGVACFGLFVFVVTLLVLFI